MEKFVNLKRKEPSPSCDLDNLPWDPADRKKISEYPSNQRDEVIRRYLIRGPCQPRGHIFKQKMISGAMRRFNHAWFDQYKNWLEYSIKKDAAYCLCCYLFRDSNGKGGKTDAWTNEGFSSWNKFSRLAEHVGQVNSFHNNAVMKCENLMRQGQSIKHALHKQDDITKNEYRIRLNASIDLLKYTAEQNETVSKVVLQNVPGNNQMVSSKIHKDIAHCFAEEVIKSIIEKIDHDVFGLLVDESADVSDKEQMAVVFRFVDKSGIVKERFISIIHVAETSSAYLKSAIDSLFSKLGLSIKKLRRQGYDGASNMKGEYNGLRSLILRENTSAYYVHCFAHQLQLVVVAVAKKHFEVGGFFDMISLLLNVVGASCKRKYKIKEDHRKMIEEDILDGKINTGKGLNQEVAIQRPGQTRWGSHYRTLLRLIELFSPIINVLKHIQNEGLEDSKRRQAYGLLVYFQDFDFVFYLEMMVHLLGLTDSLSKALQQRDQDILNAMSLVKSTKRQLQDFRDNGWHSLMDKVFSFCQKYDIEKVDMEDEFIHPKRPRKKTGIQNMHHYKVNCLYAVLDLQLQEFNDRFTEVNTELLTCVASLSPIGSFSEFDQSKLMNLAKFYPYDFSPTECISLEQQLSIYIDNVRHDERFSHLKNLGDLARMLVDTRKHLSLPLVYRLLKLALILPVATATVERCFSAMKIVKTDRRNRIGDEFLNDCLVCYIEKDVFQTVTNETAMKRFQNMKDRRMLL
ncbi:hypothetical protein BRARA_G00086 [Brassica rapa]|uniref:TTF-type domain-containing protein n=1 Tax=Brassica campestris TaxID=3711 RepID=A0A397YL56_BRACM|nr:hypothetical protein BRARA_G00086 [Brassica rapa]